MGLQLQSAQKQLTNSKIIVQVGQIIVFYYSHSLLMSSLKELTQDTTDRQDSKKLAHLKTYTFYVFYQPTCSGFVSSSLHKVSLKLRDEKPGTFSESKGTDLQRQVQILFYSLQQEAETMQGLLDLKLAGHQSKSKIVGYCTEEQLLRLLAKAGKMGIDICQIPMVATQTHPTSDLSIFSGWNQADTSLFSEMHISCLQNLSRQWIQSAPQKVDAWKLKLKLKEDGRLQKLAGQTYQAVETPGLEFDQMFLSHVSMGYHVKLSKNYQQKKSSPEKRKTNHIIYGWQRFKNFCCLGSSNMRSSTGVVNISYLDDHGQEHEILKHLRQYDGSEESELEASRVIKSDKGIYSLLLTNIDRFHGNKLEGLDCKPGDGRVEIILFQGVNKWRKIASVGGEVLLRLQSQCVQLQIGESVYRCWGARQLRVQQCGRLRVAISRQVLSC